VGPLTPTKRLLRYEHGPLRPRCAPRASRIPPLRRRFLAKLRTAGRLVVASRYAVGLIATIAPDGEQPGMWRMTYYRPDGPMGHQLFTAADLALRSTTSGGSTRRRRRGWMRGR